MRTRLVTIGVVLVLLLIGAPAVADTPQQRLARAQERLDELSRDLEIQIEECNLRREQLKAARTAVADNRKHYRKTEAQLTAVADERSRVVAEMYKDRSGGRQLSSLAATAGSLAEYAERIAWLDITQEARASAFERYSAARDQLSATGDVLQTTKRQAAEANNVAQRSCEETRRKVEAEEDHIAELAAEVERLEARARARAERREAAREETAQASQEPTETAAASAPAAAPAASGSAAAAVQFALAQVGKPYGWGGSGPNSYDCSGLTSSAWASAGVSLPHNSGMQYAATSRVSRAALRPGDLMFFGSPIHHVSMYIGNGQMVEAPRTGLTVRVVSIDRSGYVGAGRP